MHWDLVKCVIAGFVASRHLRGWCGWLAQPRSHGAFGLVCAARFVSFGRILPPRPGALLPVPESTKFEKTRRESTPKRDSMPQGALASSPRTGLAPTYRAGIIVWR